MKASEAKEMADKSEFKLNEFLSSVKDAAGKGETEIKTTKENIDLFGDKLKALGYSFKQSEVDFYSFMVSWAK